MNVEERAAAYLIIFILEESLNKLGRKDATMYSLSRVPGLSNLRDVDGIRIIRNHLAHTPLDYAEGYNLIKKHKSNLAVCLKWCSVYIQHYTEAEVLEAISILFAFYKKNK